MRTVIVISSLVDSTIREGQLDTDFLLFKSIDELAQYIELTPVRAESLFFSREIIPHTNTALNYLSSMLVNPFLKVDHVVFITEKDSSEIPSVKYIIQEKGFTNWEIVTGFLTREYINGIITGSLRKESTNSKRKAVYRVPRAAYVQDRIKNKTSLEEDYLDDEAYLKDVPPITIPEETLLEKESTCEIIHVVGLDCHERTSFCFLLAQYLSFSGKTIIIEKDTDYHRLTEYVTKSGVSCMQVEVKELLSNPADTLEKIKHSSESLVCIVAIDRTEYSYAFICNVVYNNICNDFTYFISEDDFTEAPITESYTVVVPSNVIDVLKTCERLDGNYLKLCNFVGVGLRYLPELNIPSSYVLKTILEDVLELQLDAVPLLTISSLKIGGTGYDLRSVVKRR